MEAVSYTHLDVYKRHAHYMKQQELLHTSRIQLNELMANKDVDQPFIIQDSLLSQLVVEQQKVAEYLLHFSKHYKKRNLTI